MEKPFLWTISAIFSLASCGSAGQQPEEQTILWIKERLTENLVPLPAMYADVHILKVEPCRIVLAYSVSMLSGGTVLQEIEIPTDDALVRENGEVLYSERMVSNCSPVGEDTVLVRMTAEAVRLRTSRISAQAWTGIFQRLNEKCIPKG